MFFGRVIFKGVWSIIIFYVFSEIVLCKYWEKVKVCEDMSYKVIMV